MPEGKSPPIGRLRNLASVYLWVDIPIPGNANVDPNYMPVGQCWCQLKAKGDANLLGAQIFEANGGRSGTHTIFTRFREGLTIRHMLEIAGKRYRIVSVSEDDARRFIRIEAELWGDASIIGIPPSVPAHYDDA